jgi:hypothetical protein
MTGILDPLSGIECFLLRRPSTDDLHRLSGLIQPFGGY